MGLPAAVLELVHLRLQAPAAMEVEVVAMGVVVVAEVVAEEAEIGSVRDILMQLRAHLRI